MDDRSGVKIDPVLETAFAEEVQGGRVYPDIHKVLRECGIYITASLCPLEIAHYTCGNAPCIE